MSVFYLASPIDNSNEQTGHWRQELIESLGARGHTLFDPSTAWSGNSPACDNSTSDKVTLGNNAMLYLLDGVIALLPPDCRTIGTVYEIIISKAAEKAVLVFAPGLNPSVVLNSLDIPYFTNLQEVLYAVDELTARQAIEQ